MRGTNSFLSQLDSSGLALGENVERSEPSSAEIDCRKTRQLHASDRASSRLHMKFQLLFIN